MDSSNLVSVIVNCHNSDQFIEECINSIIAQSYRNLEIIVWDNNSHDSTASILNKLSRVDKRVKYFRGDKFVPLGTARNLALQKCCGSWIAFLDSDDLWDQNFLSDQMSALVGKEEIAFGFGYVTEFLHDSRTIPSHEKVREHIEAETSIFDKLLRGNFIYFSSLVFSREALNFLKKFRDDFVQAEDYELLLRLANKFNAIQIGHAYYRLHENNLSKRQTYELYIETLYILKLYLKHRKAKVNFSFNFAKFAIYCVKSKNHFLFFQTIRSQEYSLIYLFFGLAMVTLYRTTKFFRIIRKKL